MANVKTKETKMNVMRKKSLWSELKRDKMLYLMLLPGVLFFVFFKFRPFEWFGIAFFEYNPFIKNPFAGEFVGMKYFSMLFKSSNFWMLFKNTLLLSVYSIVFFFPLPIVFALLLNEVDNMIYKKAVQTITYIPHFFSWVVIAGISFTLLAKDGGSVIVIIQQVWKDVGWGTIVYLAAMTSIDPSLYEAASMDGAGRFSKIFYITLPSIAPTIATLLILRMGSFMDTSFDQLFLMVNDVNRSVGEVFDTFIYTQGISNGKFSYTTAVGIFKSLVSMIMVVSCNWVAKKLGNEGIM